MSTKTSSATPAALALVEGIPLSEEPGLGALTLPGYLRAVTERFAAREALVLPTSNGAERWSYADLWDRSVAVARALVACGIGKNSRVGILMTNRPECLSGIFGATLAGGVAVPINTFATPPELDYMIQASAVSVLLFDGSVLKKDFVEILCGLDPVLARATPGGLESTRFPYLRHLAVVDGNATGAIESWTDFLARGNAVPVPLVEARAAAVQPSDPGVLFFSSGSTSKPKGILNAHRAVSIQLWRFCRMFGLEGDIRCWTANGFFWSGNFGMAIGGAFSCGGTIVLQRTFAAAEALTLMEQEKVNFPLAWPHQWAQLEAAPNWGTANLSALRYIDENTPLAHHPTVTAKWQEPRAYGNTETFTINTAFPACTPADVSAGSHGKALPGNSVKIVDLANGALLARGERGEIAVKGPTLMLGYIGVPIDETLDPEGFFRTGDGGYIDEAGRLIWEGRLTDIIKTGGANVSPLEIDEALTGYPGVKLARTVGVPHDTLGEMVVACVVPHDGQTLDEAAIRDFLKERLASYKVPRRVLFFRDDDMSMTASAKVKAGDLRKLAADRLELASSQ